MGSPSTFRRPAMTTLRDAQDVLHPDDEMNDTEAGYESAHEGITDKQAHGHVGVQQRIERPQPRPGEDQKKDSRLQAVEREEERNRHTPIVNECKKDPL